MSRPPNVLLVVVDCARSDKWLGPARPTRTPNFDRFASEGVSLPNTITEKSCTTPSFTTLLTGRYSPRHGVHLVWGYRLNEHVPMLSEAFARRGYHTVAEVTGPLLPEMGLARGFERYSYRAPCDYLHTAWGDAFLDRLRRGALREPWFVLLHLWELHPHRRVAPECESDAFGRDGYERASSSLDRELPRLFEAAGDALVVFTGDHGEKTRFESYGTDSAVEYARRALRVEQAEGMAPFSVAGWAGPSVLQALYGKCAPRMREMRLSDFQRPSFNRWRRLRDRLRLLRLTPFVYLTDLLTLGAPLKLTRMLERRGLLNPDRAARKADRFAAALGDEQLLDMHLRMWINSYRHNYDEGHMVHVYDFLTRVPLVIRWPGQLPAGARCERMARQPDILPTLLDLAGAAECDWQGSDGRSLRPLLLGQPMAPAPAFQSVSGLPLELEIRGVRTETHRFTYGPHNPQLPRELYDLRRDPGERVNLAASEPERCAELQALADAFVPVTPAPVEAIELAQGEQAEVERRLHELGYL